tara:strand:+ start:3810 stop:4562 length:753 start_codon:yes stop_codon:yes gene_type:complete
MKILKHFAVAALSFAGAAYADGHANGTVAFADISGYGIRYTADWITPVDYKLSASATTYGRYPIDGLYQYILVSGNLALAPTVPAGAGSFDLQVTMTMEYINLATGKVEAPAQFYEMVKKTGGGFSHTDAVNCPSGYNVELRFSNSVCDFNATAASSGGGNPANDVFRFPLAVTTSTLYHFRGGHYLSASNDPTCASFDCMTPGQDLFGLPTVRLDATIAISTVPEPATAALMLAGLAFTATVARRRRGD